MTFVAIVLGVLAAVLSLSGQTTDDELRARAERLHREAIVLDTHAVIKYIDPVERPKTPLSVFLDHIAHAIEVAGADHVELGLDYGYDAPAPEGLEHIGKLGAVTYELLKRGYDEKTVRKILGENMLRVMAEVEAVAKRLSSRR